MRANHVCVMLSLLTASAGANDSFNSELSHFAGGAAMGAGFTAIADHYGYREHRGWIGFGVSTGIGIAAELVEQASGDDFSALDAGANALGAAVGAYSTDRWWLAPVVLPEAHYVGLVSNYRF
ncbi:hypothetical protein ACW5XF_03730 [Aeromonas lusitana]|uniref:Uncharacterized protein n=1 Tax=Aeromonas lusitana TaxID=931529 RepID=A0A2M8HBH7_9GAMM|nr:hypothetical protein [Aeromonas lusitana]PJC93913.1 hypothetical protein CUC44_07095 [Aeromonas lusitana]